MPASDLSFCICFASYFNAPKPSSDLVGGRILDHPPILGQWTSEDSARRGAEKSLNLTKFLKVSRS